MTIIEADFMVVLLAGGTPPHETFPGRLIFVARACRFAATAKVASRRNVGQ
jgi:hypothetical protein